MVPAEAAGGGLVTGGRRGVDSVPILAQPGELIVPADTTSRLLENLDSPQAVMVNITAGMLAGDEGTAREMARMIQEKLRFLDTGKTL